MKGSARFLFRIFLTGLVAALPLVVAVLLFVWAGRLLVEWIGPSSMVGSLLVMRGLGMAGSESLSYLIGMGIVLVLLFVLGLLVEARLQRGRAQAFNALLRRIPVVASVSSAPVPVGGVLLWLPNGESRSPAGNGLQEP